jgi:hypothetical protein
MLSANQMSKSGMLDRNVSRFLTTYVVQHGASISKFLQSFGMEDHIASVAVSVKVKGVRCAS